MRKGTRSLQVNDEHYEDGTKIYMKNLNQFCGTVRKRVVPLLGVFGSPFSPNFLQKGSPKVPLRGPGGPPKELGTLTCK